MMIVATDSGALIGCKKQQKKGKKRWILCASKRQITEQSNLSSLHFWVWKCAFYPFLLLTLFSRRQELCIWCFSVVQTSCESPAWTEGRQNTQQSVTTNTKNTIRYDTSYYNAVSFLNINYEAHLKMDWVNESPTCFPPPLLGGMFGEISGPEGPLLLFFPVQLLQRISPWFPFFHIGEEFVLQTAQHGFNPSGIVNNQGATQRTTKPTLICAMKWLFCSWWLGTRRSANDRNI